MILLRKKTGEEVQKIKEFLKVPITQEVMRMELSKDINPMPMAQQADVNPLWPEYRRQILQSMKEQGFSAPVIEARIEIAYNRMHGLPNSPELLRTADGDQSRDGEWATGTTGKEFF